MESKQLHILGRGGKNEYGDFTGLHFVGYTNLQSKIGDIFEYNGTYLRLDEVYPDGDKTWREEYRQNIPDGFKSICKFTPLNGNENWDNDMSIIITWSDRKLVTAIWINDITTQYNRDFKIKNLLK